MRTENVLHILDSSLFMTFDHAPRQQHTLAAVEYEAAEAALHRAMNACEEDEEVVELARARWLHATVGLRNATINYLQSLSEGVAETSRMSLDEFLEAHLAFTDDETEIDETEIDDTE